MADGTGSLVEGLGAELLNNTGIPISPWDIHGEIYGMNGHACYFIKAEFAWSTYGSVSTLWTTHP